MCEDVTAIEIARGEKGRDAYHGLPVVSDNKTVLISRLNPQSRRSKHICC